MILDNDNLNAEVLKCILEYLGDCVCQVFSSPAQLLKALKEVSPDKIFCNVTAKGCDTRELFKASKADLPLIFTSSLDRSIERRLCYLDTSFPYLTYPLFIETIEQQLKR